MFTEHCSVTDFYLQDLSGSTEFPREQFSSIGKSDWQLVRAVIYKTRWKSARKLTLKDHFLEKSGSYRQLKFHRAPPIDPQTVGYNWTSCSQSHALAKRFRREFEELAFSLFTTWQASSSRLILSTSCRWTIALEQVQYETGMHSEPEQCSLNMNLCIESTLSMNFPISQLVTY